MNPFIINTFIAAILIGSVAWLSGRSPIIAGFMIAMPVSTLIVLPMSYLQHGDQEATVTLARSILIAIPVTLMFFVPFLLTTRLGLSFWQAYFLGAAILPVGFFAHRMLARLI